MKDRQETVKRECMTYGTSEKLKRGCLVNKEQSAAEERMHDRQEDSKQLQREYMTDSNNEQLKRECMKY